MTPDAPKVGARLYCCGQLEKPLSLRAEGVAISWYCVKSSTLYQEIATGLRPSR